MVSRPLHVLNRGRYGAVNEVDQEAIANGEVAHGIDDTAIGLLQHPVPAFQYVPRVCCSKGGFQAGQACTLVTHVPLRGLLQSMRMGGQTA
jgi:hypothetical protein